MAMTYGREGLDDKFYDIFVRKHGVTAIPADDDIDAWEVGTSGGNEDYLNTWTVDGATLSVDHGANWCNIGVNEANPKIATSDGNTVELNTQDTIVLSKAMEVTFNALNLTKDNIVEMQELAKYADNLDIMFVERGDAGDEVIAYIADDVNLSVNFEIDRLRKAMCKATKAHSRKQNGFTAITLTYAS